MAKNRDKKKGGKKPPPKMKAAASAKAGKSKEKKGGQPKLKLPGKKSDREAIMHLSMEANPKFLRWAATIFLAALAQLSLDKPIDELNIRGTSKKVLTDLGFITIGELTWMSDAALLNRTEFGPVMLAELNRALRVYGLQMQHQVTADFTRVFPILPKDPDQLAAVSIFCDHGIPLTAAVKMRRELEVSTIGALLERSDAVIIGSLVGLEGDEHIVVQVELNALRELAGVTTD